ncbi:very short patch repair endonuclease [Dactylosporangium roseum]|uniref:Very short patch repair endonuclease n=1 Tax=Dactylosporangium roseum TaxID=47989 RepID=A0ABY5Z9I2_9ACTN|nr:very short patch repair endonuclease [Dactylosporangium roseum]
MHQWQSTDQGRHLRGRRKTNTEPELLLRKALHAAGARFRLHRQLTPGCTPDLVLPKHKIAVFVDGDYWHSCPVHGRRTPIAGPNAALWAEKFERNRNRDRRSTQLAEQAGWTVVRLWECSIRKNPGAAAAAVLSGRALPPAT